MAAVVFDPDEFRQLYPQFEKLSDTTLNLYFKAACLLCQNDDTSVIKDLDERKMLLFMLVCHIATLKDRGDTLVGSLTGASEGKVSINVSPLNNANWYQTTQCGAMFWEATAKYRVGLRYYAYCDD